MCEMHTLDALEVSIRHFGCFTNILLLLLLFYLLIEREKLHHVSMRLKA